MGGPTISPHRFRLEDTESTFTLPNDFDPEFAVLGRRRAEFVTQFYVQF